MNKILSFLKDPEAPLSSNLASSFNEEFIQKSYKEFQTQFTKSEVGSKTAEVSLKENPSPSSGQIWLCTQTYYDYFGNEIKGTTPYYVVIVDNVTNLDNFEFVRIQPISLFTEFRADDELLVEDKTICGFEFLVEYWNEQPISVKLLDQYIGKMDIVTPITGKDFHLLPNQKTFREIEITNTSYLRQSVISFLAYKESIRDMDDCPVINLNNDLHYLTEKNNEVREDSQPYELLMAARRGNKDKRKRYNFSCHIKGEEVNLEIIKEKDIFILSIDTQKSVTLKDDNGNSYSSYNSGNKIIYKELPTGLYFINIGVMEIPIKIRF